MKTTGYANTRIDENATWKLDQHDYRKKYDGYASRYAALESRMDSLEKERERKEIQYDIFSGFLAGLSETGELLVDFNESQHGDLKPEAAGASGLCQMPPAAFSVRGNRGLLCMEICKELRYNFGGGG